MHFHLLCTVLHYKLSRYKSVNICSMLEHLSIEKEELVESTKNFVFLSLEKHLHIALDTTNSEHLIPGILGHVYSGVRQHLELNHMKKAQSPCIIMYKGVQGKLLMEPNQSQKSFSCQSHQSKHCFLAPIKQYLSPTYQQIRFSIIFLLLVMTAISIMQDSMKIRPNVTWVLFIFK